MTATIKMKKNHLKLLLFLMICEISYAQNKTNFTLENFKINLIESPVSTSYIDTYAKVKTNVSAWPVNSGSGVDLIVDIADEDFNFTGGSVWGWLSIQAVAWNKKQVRITWTAWTPWEQTISIPWADDIWNSWTATVRLTINSAIEP